jgi:hypothetical protein
MCVGDYQSAGTAYSNLRVVTTYRGELTSSKGEAAVVLALDRHNNLGGL